MRAWWSTLPSPSAPAGSACPLRPDPGAAAPKPGTAATGRVLIISGSVGAGHDGAAHELAARLRRAGVHVDVRDYLQALPAPCRVVLRDGYTASVGCLPWVFEWVFTSIECQPVVQRLTLAFCRVADRVVRRWVQHGRYDAVVSTYPLASQTLGGLKARGCIGGPLVTYLTDPAAHRTWVHEHVDVHLTATAATAAQGGTDYGLVMRTAGPLVPARFATRPPAAVLRALRVELALPEDRPIGLVVAGSLGLGQVQDTAAHLVREGLSALVLCGRNEQLLARVQSVPGATALGWRQDMHHLMHLADVLVHNAGGLSFTEALVAGLPAVSYRCIPGHGRANAAVLDRAGLAPWARDESEFGRAVAAHLTRGRLDTQHPDPAELVLTLLPTGRGRTHAAA